jgi:sigma-B regulation protein RsbU (phosphoserine phosphatase)
MDIVRVVTRLLKGKNGTAPRPDEIIACVNRELCQNNASCMFVTLFFGVLDPRSGRLRYCNAGHNAPYVVGGGAARVLDGVHSIPLGIKADRDFETASTTLARDEMLFVFSDGITEATSAAGDFYAEERLVRALLACAGRRSEEVIGSIVESIREFVKGVPQSDDITAMAIRLPSGPDV